MASTASRGQAEGGGGGRDAKRVTDSPTAIVIATLGRRVGGGMGGMGACGQLPETKLEDIVSGFLIL